MHNLYNVLGVANDASVDEIKRAYRKLVRELHPDVTSTDASRFLDVQEAYEVLSDIDRRASYDEILNLSTSADFDGDHSTVSTAQRVDTADEPSITVPVWLLGVMSILVGLTVDHLGVADSIDHVARMMIGVGVVALVYSMIVKIRL